MKMSRTLYRGIDCWAVKFGPGSRGPMAFGNKERRDETREKFLPWIEGQQYFLGGLSVIFLVVAHISEDEAFAFMLKHS